jgi:protein-S-isoprenylcysteine O-methyltransferase Ste14
MVYCFFNNNDCKPFYLRWPFQHKPKPMYLGMLLILAGTAILLKSLILLVSPVLYLLIMNLFYIRKEEADLQEQISTEYMNYKKKVRRWI